MSKLLGDIALAYATKLNFYVFPLKERDKVPLGGHGCKDATNNNEQIAKWWGNTETANIGLACGEQSGIWVLDIDGKLGEADLAYLESVNGKLPKTPCVKTANGRHFFFKYPKNQKITNRAKIVPHTDNAIGGIDVRGGGGYVVLPPSIHPTGISYEWLVRPTETDFQDAPEWLLNLVIKPIIPNIPNKIPSFSQPINGIRPFARRTGPEDIINDRLNAVRTAHEGTRNNTLHISAIQIGKLIPGGHIGEQEAINQLTMAAQACGLQSYEIQATIASGMRFGMGDPYQYGGNERQPISAAKYDADGVIIEDIPEDIIGLTIHAPTLYGKEIPEREWLVDQWILAGCVTALYGDGGVGKSLLAMQLITAIALGKPFLGLEVKQQKVFGFFCEDREDELHRRQEDINNHYGCNFTDLDNMYWQSRVGLNNILMSFIRDGLGSATEAYKVLRDEVLRVGAQSVVIDTAADTFGGGENVRPQVRQFINLLSKLAIEIGGSVILCAHPSAAGLARDDGTGGSTAWNNTVRSRLYFSRPTKKDGDELSEEDAQNSRQLVKMKSNYSTIGDKIFVKWEQGAFKLEGGSIYDKVSQIEKNNREKEDDKKFLILLDILTSQNNFVSNNRASRYNYAPKVMALMKESKGIGFGRFEQSMQRLFDDESITNGVVGIGADRHKKVGIMRKN